MHCIDNLANYSLLQVLKLVECNLKWKLFLGQEWKMYKPLPLTQKMHMNILSLTLKDECTLELNFSNILCALWWRKRTCSTFDSRQQQWITNGWMFVLTPIPFIFDRCHSHIDTSNIATWNCIEIQYEISDYFVMYAILNGRIFMYILCTMSEKDYLKLKN